MGFEEAVSHLESLGVDAMKSVAPSLHRVEAMCEALDHPERVIPAVHITGTNGKTSVATIATSLLRSMGLSVGTFTSPHLQSVRERIALSGDPISRSQFGEVFDHLLPYLELVEGQLDERLTYFEVLTVMFFLWAAEAPADALVVEVGLGGRWDATNVLHAAVAVVVNVGLDHETLLGSDRKTIAQEKSGIIKPGSVTVTAERSPDVLALIERTAGDVGGRTSVLARDFDVLANEIAVGGRFLSLQTSSARYDELYLPLHGSHQAVNAVTALEAVVRFIPSQNLARDVVAEGFGTVALAGRLEVVQAATPTSPAIVLDVAHNPAGMSALVSSLEEAFTFENVTFVTGILADKDHQGMLSEMSRVPCRLLTTRPAMPRALSAGDLAEAARKLGLQADAVDDVRVAVQRAMAMTEPHDLVCVTGSHYVVGEARSYLLGDED